MDIERNLLKHLSDDKDPKNAIRSIPFKLRRFYVQAYQSFLFNKTLSMAYEFEEESIFSQCDDVCFDKNFELGKYQNDPRQKLAIPLIGHSYYKKSRFDYYIKKILEDESLSPKDFFINDFQELSMMVDLEMHQLTSKNFLLKKTLSKFNYLVVLMQLLSYGKYKTRTST